MDGTTGNSKKLVNAYTDTSNAGGIGVDTRAIPVNAQDSKNAKADKPGKDGGRSKPKGSKKKDKQSKPTKKKADASVKEQKLVSKKMAVQKGVSVSPLATVKHSGKKAAVSTKGAIVAKQPSSAVHAGRALPADKSIAERFQKAFPYMQNRELSWLEFNKRVLDQGADPTVPLFERLGFISIFWSNLQEFFMIRVGSLTDLSLVKKAIIDSKSGMTPAEQLDAVYKRCHQLYPYYEQCYLELRKLLNRKGIVNHIQKDLDEEQISFAEDYFAMNVMPFLSPQIINARHPFPHLENGALYIVVRLDEEAEAKGDKTAKQVKDGKKKKNVKNLGAEGVTLGVIPLPRQCKRIVQLPGDGLQFILLEHLIEMFVPRVFSMYKVKHTNVICVTRNADLDANEGIEEQGEDYREHMKRILKKRARLAPVRLESERELSATVKPVLLERLNLRPDQLFVTSVPLNMSYAFDLPHLVDEQKRAELTYTPFAPQWPSCLDRRRSIIDQVSEGDVLLSYPYETMDAFVQLLREAAADPDVISIKITLYRLAKQSHLAEALIAAADAGKEVTALFELRARFDESNNIEWSQRFDQAGCNVLYGFRDYKVHSKICCITRQTENGLQYITQLGTGNYNEKTAKLYTDFCFITADPAIGYDAVQFFRNMALENTSDDYDTLWVAPLQIKQNIMAGIDRQIEMHRAGLPSGIFFKTNSITDKDLIDKIVQASQAGVKCTLLVRGISCIVPGIKGFTENVCVDSIVGRLLEHSRIYCFGPLDGDVQIYLSSADLMTRNMDKRIEIAWPVSDEELRSQIIGYIGTCMADTAKLRDLLPTREYTDLGLFAKPAGTSGRVEMFDSQSFLMDEALRKNLEASEEAVADIASNADIVRRIEEVIIDAEDLSDAREEGLDAGFGFADGNGVLGGASSAGGEEVFAAEDMSEDEAASAALAGEVSFDDEGVVRAVADGDATEAVSGGEVDAAGAVVPDGSAEALYAAVNGVPDVADASAEDVLSASDAQAAHSNAFAGVWEVTDAEGAVMCEVGEGAQDASEYVAGYSQEQAGEDAQYSSQDTGWYQAPEAVSAAFAWNDAEARAGMPVYAAPMPGTQLPVDVRPGIDAGAEPCEDAGAQGQTVSGAVSGVDAGTIRADVNGSEMEVEPLSQLEKRELPKSLPLIDGAPTYEVLGVADGSEGQETLEFPNTQTGLISSVAVAQSEYTDPNTKPEDLKMPEKKRSLFKRLFG